MADAFFTEQHELVRKLAREFAETELTKEILDKVEEEEVFPEEILDKMAKAGFFGIKVPKQYGGQGGDARSYVIVMEEIARVSGVASIYVSSPNSLSGGPFLLSGNAEQKEKYLRPVVTGEKKVCFALTEPGAGSDAGGMQTTAVKDGDYYVLNGRKTFITMAPLADWAVVYAKTDMSMGTKGISAFIVDMKQEGVSCGKPEKKMGVVGCATSDIILENVRVHKDNLLGQEGKGFINAMKTLDTGRMGVAAQSIGVAQGCLDEAIKYAKERKQFGKPITAFQNTQFRIAELQARIDAARLLTWRAAVAKDNGEPYNVYAAEAKLVASDVANDVCRAAVQFMGGYGYCREYGVERKLRDVKITEIYEGTSEVMKMVISGSLLR